MTNVEIAKEMPNSRRYVDNSSESVVALSIMKTPTIGSVIKKYGIKIQELMSNIAIICFTKFFANWIVFIISNDFV